MRHRPTTDEYHDIWVWLETKDNSLQVGLELGIGQELANIKQESWQNSPGCQAGRPGGKSHHSRSDRVWRIATLPWNTRERSLYRRFN